MSIYTDAPMVTSTVVVPYGSNVSVEIYDNCYQVILVYRPSSVAPRVAYVAFSADTTTSVVTQDNKATFPADTNLLPQTFKIEVASRRPLGDVIYLVSTLSASPAVGQNSYLSVTQICQVEA
jgi:hypothetical protein